MLQAASIVSSPSVDIASVDALACPYIATEKINLLLLNSDAVNRPGKLHICVLKAFILLSICNLLLPALAAVNTDHAWKRRTRSPNGSEPSKTSIATARAALKQCSA
jgi:hypothetical protein